VVNPGKTIDTLSENQTKSKRTGDMAQQTQSLTPVLQEKKRERKRERGERERERGERKERERERNYMLLHHNLD
jgi:hypothetical protein